MFIFKPEICQKDQLSVTIRYNFDGHVPYGNEKSQRYKQIVSFNSDRQC